MPGEKGPLPWAPGPAPSPPSGTGPATQRAGVSRGPAARETRRVCAHQGFLEIKFGAGVVNALEAVGAHVTGCASWRPDPQPPPGPSTRRVASGFVPQAGGEEVAVSAEPRPRVPHASGVSQTVSRRLRGLHPPEWKGDL